MNMKKSYITIIFFIFSLTVFSNDINVTKSEDNIGYGPLMYHISSPLRCLTNNLPPISANKINPGEAYFTQAYSYLNIWNYKKNFFTIDMETFVADYIYEIGLKNDYVLCVKTSVISRDGGFLDKTIENFHKLIGISNENREEEPRNSLKFEIKDTLGHTYSIPPEKIKGVDFGNVHILLQKNIFTSKKFARSFMFMVKIPTSPINYLINTGKPDITLSYSWAKKLKERKFLYLTLGTTRFGRNHLGNIPLKRTNNSLSLSYEFGKNDRIHHYLQLYINEKITRYIPEYDKATYILNYGFKRKYKNYMISFSVIENLFVFDNSPDVGFYFSKTIKAK